MVLTKMK